MNKLLRHPLACASGLAAITFLCLAPFFGKAFHVDDPIFLWPAQQMLAGNPHPLAAPVNWYGTNMPLVQVTKNPPGASLLMLPVVTAAGFSEVPLHLEFALFASLAIAGIYLLARQLCDRPVLAALLVLASPAFFVSAMTVMSDVPMFCFWVWSIVAWLWAGRSGRVWGYLISGLLFTAAAMCKYPAVALVPLLAVAAIRRRGLAWQIIALLMPALALIALQFITRAEYGYGLVWGAVDYAADVFGNAAVPVRLLNGLSFVGGSFPAIAVAWSLQWSARQARRIAIASLVLAVIVFAARDQLLQPSTLFSDNLALVTWHAVAFSMLGLWML